MLFRSLQLAGHPFEAAGDAGDLLHVADTDVFADLVGGYAAVAFVVADGVDGDAVVHHARLPDVGGLAAQEAAIQAFAKSDRALNGLYREIMQRRMTVREAERMQKDLAGIKIFYIALQSNTEGAFRDPANPPSWVGLMAWVAAVCFNTVEAAKKGIPKSESWQDLTKPEYKGKIVIPSLQNTEGLALFMMAAALETGKVIQVPLFINPGDKVKVDTRSGEYITRV